MRKQFDIKYRPQIESGEYRVETQEGCPVRIVCWDMACELPILGLVLLNDEKAEETAVGFTNEGTNLLGEPLYDKLFIVTPEPKLSEFEERIFKLIRQYKECDIPLTPENIKAEASMLWQDFEKYFFNLYGRYGEGDSALRSFYYRGLADGKAEALKDLPRWKKCDHNTIYNTKLNLVINGVRRYIILDGYMIDVDSLEKLPGFKEDGHE